MDKPSETVYNHMYREAKSPPGFKNSICFSQYHAVSCVITVFHGQREKACGEMCRHVRGSLSGV